MREFPSQFESATAERRPYEFQDDFSREEYLSWKDDVPQPVRSLVERVMKGNEAGFQETGLPSVDAFLNNLGASLAQGSQHRSGRPLIDNLLEPLAEVETEAGHLNLFETLVNPEASWTLKTNLYKTQIEPALEWLVQKDLREKAEAESKEGDGDSGEEQKQEGQDQEETPPPSGDDVISSMEAGGDQKEKGPIKPLFSVKPFYGGYARQSAFNRLNPSTLKWEKPENEFEDATAQSLDFLGMRLMSGKVRGGTPLALPLYYDWALDPASLETDAPEGSAAIIRNQDGAWYLVVDAEGDWKYNVKIAPRQTIEPKSRFDRMDIQGTLPSGLASEIESIKKSGASGMKLKREIVKAVRNHLTYSNSREAWEAYTKNPRRFFEEIWNRKEADCFVANTMACRALQDIDPRTRFVSGYFIQEKSASGDAVMHSGNGHAWIEVWDDMSDRPIRLDATPKGDPTIDEEQQERELEGESGEGDFGEREDEIASREDVEKEMENKPKKEQKDKKPRFTREESSWSGLAECSPEEARQFLEALERVRQIKDEEGTPISDRMKDEWKKIIEERKVELRDYRGPVRMDEGTRLEDPVAAVIDIRSKEFNPIGFEKDETVEKIETDFGGIDIYFSFDLSGSMKEPDPVSGRAKADVQRDAGLLFVDSLMQCAAMTRREGATSDLLPVKIMVTLASDRGKVELPLTDSWGPKEQWAFYKALHRLASGGTPTHETLDLIGTAFDKEAAELKKRNVPKDKEPLQYVIEVSDGAPDNPTATENSRQALRSKGMVVRNHEIGRTLRSFSELPQALAKDIITEFKKLRPRKVSLYR